MTHISSAEWHQRALDIRPASQAFINGRFVDAASGKTYESISPIDGRVISAVASCGPEDVDRAVDAARTAFEDGRWRLQSPRERKRTLLAFADLVALHHEELALLETLDMGKPISDAMAVDVPAVINTIRWYAESIDKIYDEIAPTDDDNIAMIRREPLGVVGLVVPWNFPMIMAGWKFAPALAMGNSVVLKPAEQSSLTALRLAELASQAGIPDGVFNVVPGFGPDVGQPLGMHMDVDGLFFTGSTEVGKMFMRYSADSNCKVLGLELGGKSPNIILSSYKDIDAAADAAASAIFFNQGEMCTAGSRLVVERGVHEQVVERLKKHAAARQPGDPLDPATKMGAMVDERHTQRVMGFVAVARQDGAQIAVGGERVRAETGGCYIQPTVFDHVSNDMRIAQEEIFGPMLTVIPVADPEEAIRVANDSIYGLAAAVWSDDINIANRVAKSLRAGMVYVNCYDCDDMTVPFGGYKQSGIGRDKSLHALDKYTELKTTWLRLK